MLRDAMLFVVMFVLVLIGLDVIVDALWNALK